MIIAGVFAGVLLSSFVTYVVYGVVTLARLK